MSRKSLHPFHGVLPRLARELPPFSESADCEDADLQCRATLSLVVERALASSAGSVPVPREPMDCPNCGNPANSDRSPYCSDACRAESAFVRQLRNGLSNGSVFDEARQIAFGEKLWHLLGGGYPRRQKLALERTLATVFKREEGKCQTCGATATTVDHLGSG